MENFNIFFCLENFLGFFKMNFRMDFRLFSTRKLTCGFLTKLMSLLYDSDTDFDISSTNETFFDGVSTGQVEYSDGYLELLRFPFYVVKYLER